MSRLLPFATIIVPAIVLLGPVLPLPARAAQSYDNCTGFIDALPATIGTQGTWCLRHDLNTAISSGNAITIATNNVTIDCNDFKVGGLAAGFGTATTGIYANTRYNATVRHCNVRGFLYGIDVEDGSGHLIENNNFDSNTLIAIQVTGAGSTVRDNRINHTGGSSYAPGVSVGIEGENGVDILGNTISNGVPMPSGGNADSLGISTNANGDGSIVGNRIRGMHNVGTGTAYGIFNTDSGRTIVRDNDVQGLGPIPGSIGVSCSSNQGTARDNVISGFETGIDTCDAGGNTVNTN